MERVIDFPLNLVEPHLFLLIQWVNPMDLRKVQPFSCVTGHQVDFALCTVFVSEREHCRQAAELACTLRR